MQRGSRAQRSLLTATLGLAACAAPEACPDRPTAERIEAEYVLGGELWTLEGTHNDLDCEGTSEELLLLTCGFRRFGENWAIELYSRSADTQLFFTLRVPVNDSTVSVDIGSLSVGSATDELRRETYTMGEECESAELRLVADPLETLATISGSFDCIESDTEAALEARFEVTGCASTQPD